MQHTLNQELWENTYGKSRNVLEELQQNVYIEIDETHKY